MGTNSVMAEYGWELSAASQKKAKDELNEIPEKRKTAIDNIKQQMITRPDICKMHYIFSADVTFIHCHVNPFLLNIRQFLTSQIFLQDRSYLFNLMESLLK